MSSSVVIDFTSCRRPAFHYRSLHYFILGLRSRPGLTVSIHPATSKVIRPLFDLGLRGAQRAWGALHGGADDGDAKSTGGYVRLTFTTPGRRDVKVAIDGFDSRHPVCADGLEWCDLYFKTNYWPALDYPNKVRPLMNANGQLSMRDLRALKAMRAAPPSRDLVYWSTIWEPSQSVEDAHNIVEHQIRLFEALARLTCDADLIAIVPLNLRAAKYADVAKRLEARGVRCQPDWGNIDAARIRAGLARARVAFLGPGNHLSISWRMTELLAMGACIFYDGAPFPNWQVPLIEDVHYLSGDCALTPEFVLPSPRQYAQLADRITNLFADEDTLTEFRSRTADYFDTNCMPETVADYILRRVESVR